MDNNVLTKSKIIDKIKIYEKTGEIQVTNFLDPLDIIECASIYNKFPFCLCGGKEDAERKRLVIGTDSLEEAKDYISIIKVKSIKKLGHRDVLGSVLGLGLKRDVVGDILINDTISYIFANQEIANYIKNNLKQIGREKVEIEIVSIEEVEDVSEKFEIQNITLSSLRVDSAISECYGVSRAISSKLIEAEKVKLNYKSITNSAKAIKEGDLISVRGYGRFVIEEVIGETRKGRIRIQIKKSK